MRSRALIAIGLLAAGTLLSGCQATSNAAEADTITFATTPLGDDPTADNPIEAFAGLVADETGMEVEVVDVPDYTAVVEAIRNHHVDIGFMSGFPSALAVNTGEVDSLVAWPGDGEPVSTCLVLDDSPLQSLDDITQDTVVAFADPASSSGYFMPVAMLHDAGLEQDVDYTPMFAGGHDMSFIALQEGQVDVACTSTIFPSMTGTDMFPFAEGETRSIGLSDSMPVAVSVLADQEIDPETRQLLLEALPSVFVDENAEALGSMFEAMQGTEPILEPEPSIFEPFVEIAAIADVDISDLE